MKKIALALLVVNLASGAVRIGHSEDLDPALNLQERIQTIPKNRKPRLRAKLTMELGLVHYNRREYPLAIQYLEKALYSGPSTAVVRRSYRNIGRSYANMGRIDKAIEAFEKAVIVDKRNWRRHRELAGLYEQAGLYPSAVSSYEKSIWFNGKVADVHLALGRTWRKMNLYEYAEDSLRKAESLGNESQELYMELSHVLAGMGRMDEGAKMIRRALTEESSLEDWCRLIYLSAFAKEQELANEGLAVLRQRALTGASVLFYEEFVDLMINRSETVLKHEIVEPHLRRLVQTVWSKRK